MFDRKQAAILGLCVADAVGVPVEFEPRSKRKEDPVIDMRAFGTHHQPAGTWSDDTSLTLCLVDSLSRGWNLSDMLEQFKAWYQEGKYTPHGHVFDIGIATSRAIERYIKGMEPMACGGDSEMDNGNGSLMRILPLCFYLEDKFGRDFNKNPEAYERIHQVSSLTHAHIRSKIACGIYLSIVSKLDPKSNIATAIKQGVEDAFAYYRKQEDTSYHHELFQYKRLEAEVMSTLHEEDIKSSGYVVDTLEAAIWCLLNSSSYKECVLKAVNLGEDTDTVAAVAGGLAGLYYGLESIPKEWLEQIARLDWIKEKLWLEQL